MLRRKYTPSSSHLTPFTRSDETHHFQAQLQEGAAILGWEYSRQYGILPDFGSRNPLLNPPTPDPDIHPFRPGVAGVGSPASLTAASTVVIAVAYTEDFVMYLLPDKVDVILQRVKPAPQRKSFRTSLLRNSFWNVCLMIEFKHDGQHEMFINLLLLAMNSRWL